MRRSKSIVFLCEGTIATNDGLGLTLDWAILRWIHGILTITCLLSAFALSVSVPLLHHIPSSIMAFVALLWYVWYGLMLTAYISVDYYAYHEISRRRCLIDVVCCYFVALYDVPCRLGSCCSHAAVPRGGVGVTAIQRPFTTGSRLQPRQVGLG